jgi:ferredoxin
MCERIAPSVFHLVDGERLVAVDQEAITMASLDALREAEAVCPTGAIHIE